MSRLPPVPYGAGILLVPDYISPIRDERIVKPLRLGLRHG